MNLAAWDMIFTETPDDFDSRLVYADWLEDENLPVLASGQRWQVAHKRYPVINYDDQLFLWDDTVRAGYKYITIHAPTFRWYAYWFLPQGFYSTTFVIWKILNEELRHLALSNPPHFVLYQTRIQAENVLAHALEGVYPHTGVVYK